MKLYATTEAQKLQNGKFITVKKGQGSNEQINVMIHIDDEKNPRYRLLINKRPSENTDIVLVDMKKPFPHHVVFRETIKGKRQKGASIASEESEENRYRKA